MPAQEQVFNGSWLDNEGNSLTITGESVVGPAGMKIDIAIESAETCLMQMGDDIFEGKLSSDRSRIVWSDGEVWKRNAPAQRESQPVQRGVFRPEARGQPSLTLEKALSMQEDLRNGFKNTAFQMKLSELHRKFPDGGSEYTAARNDLFLEVQSKVLPKYGFEGNQKGVIQMLAAAARWNDNKEFRDNRDALNRLIALDVDASPQKPANAKSGTPTLGVHNILFRNPRADIASAHQHLLGPNSLHLQLSKPGGKKVGGASTGKPLAENFNRKNRVEELIQRPPTQDAQNTKPAQEVEIVAREALGDLEIKVVVPGNATFNEVKEAISRHVGRADCVRRGHLVRQVDGTYTPFKGTSPIGTVRDVLVLRASLEVHNDDDARAWRAELDASIQERKSKHASVVAAAKKRQEALAEKELEIASREAGEMQAAAADAADAPHGDCFIVGTWDSFSGKHEMAWDGSAYRIGMNLQGMEEVSFQVLANDSWESRIYPSAANAGPGVPHTVMGPDGEKNDRYWTLHVEAGDGKEEHNTYEIALTCPSGRPMYLQWEKISLDSISWYPTEEGQHS